jgi:uncharacterized protein
MPINANYQYLDAERKYANATTLDEKIQGLQEMIKTAPKHKGSENLLAELKTRLKKFLEKKEKNKSSGKSTLKTIKKEGFQCAIIGLPNVGKSTLLSKITNARPFIHNYAFSTKYPEIGTLDYQGIKAQIIDLPSIGSDYFDIGISNTADLLIIVIEDLKELEKIEPFLEKSSKNKIIAINKIDLLDFNQQRKLQETIKSKKLPAVPISATKETNLIILKEKIIEKMNVIRVYLKEPSKPPTKIPMVLPYSSNVKNVAERIYKGFSSKIKETRVTGPSSKFPNQKVGLSHILKDKDIVEFHSN